MVCIYQVYLLGRFPSLAGREIVKVSVDGSVV